MLHPTLNIFMILLDKEMAADTLSSMISCKNLFLRPTILNEMIVQMVSAVIFLMS